jgi:hypothetical protein
VVRDIFSGMSPPQLGEVVPSDYEEALAFRAPYLIDKIIEEGLAATVEEAEAIFLEVKRYIVMTHACVPRWGITANACRIDEVWHNFVLFTRQYEAYCQKYFGRFMHHAPSNSPEPPSRPGHGGRETPSVDSNPPKSFREHYESFYGIELPDVWRDELHVTISRRAIGRVAGLSLHPEGDEVRVVAPDGKTMFAVDQRRLPAMQFIVPCQPFFVRELPGELSDDEKISLVSNLVARKLVRIY